MNMEGEYIGKFIRSFRQAKGESLQSLADRSGVSRSMIGHIESGQKSPTIAVLSKLAKAMSISLSDLVKPPEDLSRLSVSEACADNLVSRRGSPFVCHQLVSLSATSPVDVYRFYFSRYGKTQFSANAADDAIKYILVEAGCITLHLANDKVDLSAGQTLHFRASLPHRFENRQGELARGTFVVVHKSHCL